MVESVTNLFSSGNGQTNAIDLLKADHDRVDALFGQVRESETDSDRRTFEQIRRELEIHTHIEEHVFYPHLLSAGNEELKKITREAIEEHRQAKEILEELEMQSGDQGGFQAKLKVLMEDVEHHVQEEEGEMFPLVRDQMNEETLLRLGTLMEAEKVRFSGGSSRSASAG